MLVRMLPSALLPVACTYPHHLCPALSAPLYRRYTCAGKPHPYCATYYAIWTPSAGNVSLPKEAGLPLGFGSYRYFTLINHYVIPNPGPGQPAVRDSSGIVLYLTQQARSGLGGWAWPGELAGAEGESFRVEGLGMRQRGRARERPAPFLHAATNPAPAIRDSWDMCSSLQASRPGLASGFREGFGALCSGSCDVRPHAPCYRRCMSLTLPRSTWVPSP